MWQTYLLTNIADLLQFFSLSILTLTLKEEQAMLARTEASSYKTKSRGNIEERFDQNEKQNENEEKEKSITFAMLFSFVTSSGEMSNFLREDLERVLQL